LIGLFHSRYRFPLCLLRLVQHPEIGKEIHFPNIGQRIHLLYPQNKLRCAAGVLVDLVKDQV